MDDEPMWVADGVVALTFSSAITIPETVNKFAIKGNHLTLIKGNQFDGITKTDPHKHIHEFLEICGMFKYKDTKNEVVRLMMFPLSLTGEAKTWLDELNEETIKMWDELRTAFISQLFRPALFDRFLGQIQAFSQHEYEYLLPWSQRNNLRCSKCRSWCNSDTDKIMDRMDAMTMKMDAQYKDFQSRSKQLNLDDDDIPMSREEESKFMQTFRHTRFYNDYRVVDSNRDNWQINNYNRDNYQSHSDDKPDLQKQLNDFIKAQHSTNSLSKTLLWI
nr:reverse transcriptase domain-containing protein [Tanacetum cinerariifolium]